MQIYEVGGAVRDALLGVPFHERDWVVVGGSADELVRLGYRQVGTDFPVYLHPQSGEEYALARTEVKTSPGYQGFKFNTGRTVTLEEDLLRRDLTINAMARDADGKIIDPYGGRRDLAARILRHVSPAFVEDPLRVLRVARFAARYASLGFTIAPDTIEMMRHLSNSGELNSLRAERVWLETEKALATDRPDVYIEVLHQVGALEPIFPEFECLFGVPQPERWHPEIDTGVHLLMALHMAAKLSPSLAVRFAVLTHNLGKGTTPREILPSHRGHEQRSVDLIEQFCARLPVPKKLRQTAELVAAYHGKVHRANEMHATKVFDLLLRFDALRQPQRLEEILLACEADSRGRLGLEDQPYPQADRIRQAAALAGTIRIDAIDNRASLSGSEIGEALREAQRKAVVDGLNATQAVP